MQQFQNDMAEWGYEVLGREVMENQKVRAYRFLEEALELAQACGVSAEETAELTAYTFGRPIGEVDQEVGGVMSTLTLLVEAYGLDLACCAWGELARISNPEKIAKIRSKISNTVLPHVPA